VAGVWFFIAKKPVLCLPFLADKNRSGANYKKTPTECFGNVFWERERPNFKEK
jgi:hypothetical protein